MMSCIKLNQIITTHIKIKKLFQKKKKGTIWRKYYIHPLCGSTNLKKFANSQNFQFGIVQGGDPA